MDCTGLHETGHMAGPFNEPFRGLVHLFWFLEPRNVFTVKFIGTRAKACTRISGF